MGDVFVLSWLVWYGMILFVGVFSRSSMCLTILHTGVGLFSEIFLLFLLLFGLLLDLDLLMHVSVFDCLQVGDIVYMVFVCNVGSSYYCRCLLSDSCV